MEFEKLWEGRKIWNLLGRLGFHEIENGMILKSEMAVFSFIQQYGQDTGLAAAFIQFAMHYNKEMIRFGENCWFMGGLRVFWYGFGVVGVILWVIEYEFLL